MGRKRNRMIDTSVPEQEVEVGRSRTKARAELKDHQARLESLATQLATLPPERRRAFEFGKELDEAVALLASSKKGSALARQRKRVAKLLRPLDLDAIEARLATVAKKPGRSSNR
jgi:ribosomal 50S subunit-associated protein YjgA (DUF615 family)